MDDATEHLKHRLQLDRSKFEAPVTWPNLAANQEKGGKEHGCLPVLKLTLDASTREAFSSYIISNWEKNKLFMCYANKKKSKATLAGFPGAFFHKASGGVMPDGVGNVAISVGKPKAGGLAHERTSSPRCEAPPAPRQMLLCFLLSCLLAKFILCVACIDALAGNVVRACVCVCVRVCVTQRRASRCVGHHQPRN